MLYYFSFNDKELTDWSDDHREYYCLKNCTYHVWDNIPGHYWLDEGEYPDELDNFLCICCQTERWVD